RSDILSAKEVQHAELQAWIAADPRRAPYGAALAELRKVVADDLAYWRRDRVYSALVQTPLLLNTAVTAYRLAFEQQFPDASRDPGFQARDRSDIADRFRSYDRILDLPSDRALMKELLQQSQALPEGQRIPPLDAWLSKSGSIQNVVDELYAATALASVDARLRLLDQKQPDFERAADPWIRLAVALDGWHRGVRAEKRVRDGALARLRPVYMEAMLKMHPGAVYPEANGTLRLSFGKVEGYAPEDGAVHLPQTTLGGMARKVRESPFDAPLRVLEEVPAAPRSRWSDPTLGDVPVNFLTTVDNTNGNSGSPTLNAHGEIVGLVFDRNWEAVAADWRYDPALTRSIHVDVRYLLWMLDEVERAQVLLSELGVR
ncbi:MAG: S46 family peptidase, partial [Deltaproteobacteria bacterium]|nr:S46 family peptidase [Deltaproteobacteria bacterium]